MAQSHKNPSGTSDTLELAKALEHIESALSGVLSRIQQLNEESQKAKIEISQTFGRQLSHLHSRETQLLRQVDVIFRSRGELLQKQLAYCYRVLGALETSRKCSEQLQKYSCDLSIDSGEFEEMKKWATSIPLNWTLNEEVLNEAITNFGKVDMEGVLLLPNAEQSSCLPARVEEYFEEDHQVLNKPLHSNIIDIKFPKLKKPKDYSYWLSRSTQQEEKQDSSYGPYRKGTDSYKPCDVQTWLGCIQSETATEMDDVSESSPELVSLSDNTSLNSKDSESSIEIVSSSNLCLKFSNEHGEGCQQVMGGDFEIENLADNFSACFKGDKQRWLVSEPKEAGDIPIAKACRANAVCGSYDVCVCDIKCHDLARKNREEKEKQENKSSDYRYWLRPASPFTTPLPANKGPQFSLFSDDDYTNWLHPDSLASLTKSTSNKIPEFPSIFSDGDYCKWLHPDSLAGARASKDVANSLFKYQVLHSGVSETGSNLKDALVTTSASNVDNIWLASGSVNQTLSLSDALNEMRQSSGKLAHVQNSWTQWLKR